MGEVRRAFPAHNIAEHPNTKKSDPQGKNRKRTLSSQQAFWTFAKGARTWLWYSAPWSPSRKEIALNALRRKISSLLKAMGCLLTVSLFFREGFLLAKALVKSILITGGPNNNEFCACNVWSADLKWGEGFSIPLPAFEWPALATSKQESPNSKERKWNIPILSEREREGIYNPTIIGEGVIIDRHISRIESKISHYLNTRDTFNKLRNSAPNPWSLK